MPPLIQPENRQRITEVLKALGYPIRLQITEELVEGPLNVSELERRLLVPQAILSQQLKVLRFNRVVTSEKSNGFTYYSLFNPHLVQLLHCLQRCQEHCQEEH